MDDLDGVPRGIPEPDPVLGFWARFKALANRVGVLERAASQLSMSISQDGRKRITFGPLSFDVSKYGIEVLDNAAKPRVRLGELQSQPGSYGAEVLAGSAWVPISSAVVGGISSSVSGTYPISVPPATNTGWLAVGPSLAVQSYTGKLDINIGAALVVAGNKSTLAYSYKIEMAGTLVVGPDRYRGVACTHNGFGIDASQQAGFPTSHDLAPGYYVVTAMAQLFGSAGGATDSSITNRTLSVKGY